MASDLSAQIDALDDLLEACELMDELDISTKGLSDLEHAKTRLRVEISKQRGGRTSLPDQDVMTKLVKADQAKRDKLIGLYGKVKKFLSRLPEAKLADVRRAFPDLDKELDAGERSLRLERCAILVAGETSAGKSTLLNLLLGQTNRNLLPVAHLSVTSVICELKYGERPHAVAHPWPDDEATRAVEIPLSDSNADEVLSDYIYQKGDRDKKFKFQRVEIFWPSEWLRAGVTIVDSPGIGESEEMTALVKEYMPKAFGFIYVINSTNAGGIQQDRLQDLLLNFTSGSEDDEEGWQLDPRAAVFVANKWEGVPGKEREEVAQNIYSKLDDIWTGMSKSQVFFLSAKEAMNSLKEGVVNDDYGKLLDGIETLLPIGLNQRIAKHFSYVSMVMQTATRILRTYVTQLEVSDLEREATCLEAMERLRQIEKKPKDIQKELKRRMGEEIDKGIAKIKEHLNKPEVIEDICHWENSQCPDSNKLDDLEELIYAHAMKRIRNDINVWDKENKIFEGIQSRLMEDLKKKFLSLESELNKIEVLMTAGQNDIVSKAKLLGVAPTEEEENSKLSTRTKVLLGVSAPVWVPLGLVVGLFALPVYGIKGVFKRRAEKKEIKGYRANKTREMKSSTKLLLGYIQDTVKLKTLLEDKIGTTQTLVRKLLSRIPDMIEADKQIIQQLQQKRDDDDSTLQPLYPLQEAALDSQGEMDLMYMLDIRSYDIDVKDLVGWKVTDTPVAQGNFAKVFKASLVRPGERGPTPCAVKILKDEESQDLCPLTPSNASDAWLEESNLRKLQNPHIVKYFGSALKTDGDDCYLLMVMEFCACSLESYIGSRECYMPPGECHGDNEPSFLQCVFHATDLARQIAEGILGIHARGFLHRDLKPANILMTHDNKIRLADLGLSKSEKKMTGTLAGTLLYMAPEIIKTSRYHRSADMFSYGHILWELWYGRSVFEVYKLNNVSSLPTQAFKRQRRPEAKGVWCKTMLGCWSETPEKRPDVAISCQQFAEYMIQLKKPKPKTRP